MNLSSGRATSTGHEAKPFHKDPHRLRCQKVISEAVPRPERESFLSLQPPPVVEFSSEILGSWEKGEEEKALKRLWTDGEFL